MYDGKIGRWLSTDPMGQYDSPYVGMGNDPVNSSDPTGGFDWYTNNETGKTTWIEGTGNIDGYTHLGGADYTFPGYALNEVNITAKSLGIGQPSFGTSLIPVYGSARSSIDYFQRGKWGMGTFQAAMAVSDLFLVKSLATAGVKLGAGLIGKFAVEETAEIAAKGGSNVVYQGIDKATNTVKYVGITERSAVVRWGEHYASGTGKALLEYQVVPGATNLSRIEARVWEQNLINHHGLENLLNVRNSIASKNWWQYGIK
jgi:hypothetical protein